MRGYNLPDNIDVNDPEAPWNQEVPDDIEPIAYQFQNYFIPDYMMGAIRRYIEKGIPPGDFLTAVICNDLAGAVGRADDTNIANLPAYVAYFWNKTPAPCWGSKEKMVAWLKRFQKDPEKEVV